MRESGKRKKKGPRRPLNPLADAERETDASPVLQDLKTMNTDRAREVVGSMDDYRLIAERLEKLLADVKYTAEARWAEVAAEAMHSLRIASACARDPNDSDLAAHVATVRRHLGRRNAATGKRKKEPKPK